MSTYVPQHYAAATLFRLGVWLNGTAQTLRILATRLDAVIAARRKAVDDRRVLSEMSERELRDIGICGAQLQVFRSVWSLQGHERLRTMEWRHPM